MQSILVAALVASASAFSVGAPGFATRQLRAASPAVSMQFQNPFAKQDVAEKTKASKLDTKGMTGKVVSTGRGGKDEEPEEENLMQKVKDAGSAGIISYIFWEWAFWGVSVPVALFGFKAATGEFPDFQNSDDMAKLGAEAFAFVNVARFAVPLRIGLALGTTPWVQTNIVDKFQKKD